MIRNLTAIGKTMLLPYLFILFLLVVPNTSFAQRKLNAAANTTKSSTSPKEAQATRDKSLSQQGVSPLEQFKNKKENLSKRDMFSKHFENGDGTNTAMIGAGPIHYEKNGQFLDINHNIVSSGNTSFPYVNNTNLFESHFGATAHQGVKNITKEGEITEFLNAKMYWEVNGQAIQTQVASNSAISIEADKAYYKNLYGAIDAEFAIESGRRKLNYVIPTRAALRSIPANADYLVFTEDLLLPQGWNYKKNEKSGIELYDNTGKLAYLYENPFSMDAADQLQGDNNTTFETVLNGTTLTIKTKVQASWLLDTARVFPIKVDPTVNVYPSYNPDTHSTGQANSAGGGTYGDIAIGRNSASTLYRGWASFNTNTIPDNVTINSALLSVRVGTINGSLAAKGAMLRAFTGNPDTDYSTYTQIYNAIENFAAYNVTIIGLTATGWQNNIALPAAALNQIQNGLTNDRYSLGFGRTGSWSASQNMVINGYQSANPPYLAVTYTEPNYTLTVNNSYGTPANGTYTYAPNTQVTATAGTNPGYSVAGWTGTGSVPATGTGSSVTFNITANSSITWNWVSETVTGAPTFHNTGGTEQLAFNNSRIATDAPTFRLSHGINPATTYQINIQDNPTFTGAGDNYTQSFTGTYPNTTEANYTFSQATGSLTPGKTYYVRARTSGDYGTFYSAWTTVLHSFTYAPTTELAHWFQTAQAQLATATVSGVTATADNLVMTSNGGNIVVNGDFNSAISSGWSTSKSYNSAINAIVNSGDSNCTTCTPAGTSRYFKMGYPWAVSSVLTSDNVVLAQTLDLTNVNQITFNLGKFRSMGGLGTATNCALTFRIGGTTGNETGTVLYTNNLNADGSSNVGLVTIDVSAYTGVQTIKFVFKTLTTWDSNTTAFFYVSDVKALAPPSGTATSTAFQLASVQGAAKYDKIEWDQTLAGGSATMKVQSSANGTTWTDVAGFTNITYTGDGLQSHDISSIAASPYLRVVAALAGTTNATMIHDWAIYAQEPCEAMITSAVADNSNICANTNTTLTAVANDPAHEIRWYTTATGGSVVATGATYTTPNLTANTTYYVTAFNGTCESDVRTAVAITVNAAPSNVTVAIGTPANGLTHHIQVSWPTITGATQYQIDYSWDNTNWSTGGFSTTTTLNVNLFDNPNRIVYIRVKRYDNGGLPDCFTYANPIYTAAETPALVALNNPTGTSMQLTLGTETPVANPAITTYSLYSETTGLYVQADGTLGATEVFQTKAAWGTVTVIGLTAETEYCFYAKAKNQDGDVRFTPATTLTNESFNSAAVVFTGGNSVAGRWFAPNSQLPFVYNNAGCNGGRIGYESSASPYWSNFLNAPAQNLTGMTEVSIQFTLSNSYNAANPAGNFLEVYRYDDAYRYTCTSIKIDGVPYASSALNRGKIEFDVLRSCATVEMTFSLNPANNLSSMTFQFVGTKAANTTGYALWLDDYKTTQGDSFASPDAVCLTTGPDCDAIIASVTNGSGCAGILLQATASAETTEYLWYDAATGGNLVATTATGEWTTPTLAATTTYYVAASNGTCESARIAVTATKTAAEAEMMFWTANAIACKPTQVMLYAETIDDAMYEVNWYTTATGGTPFHTGYELNYLIANTTILYVAATDGTCESPREAIEITLEGRVWNGSVSNDWSIPNNWTPAIVPTLNECVTIPETTNSPILTGNGEAKSLSLLANAELVVTTGGAIKVSEEVNVAATANFTLENDAYLLQIVGGQTNNNVGNITVHRNSEPMFRLEATGWSSPVENQGLYAFSPQTVSGRIYEYNETTNAFDNTNITNTSVFARGKGYSVRAPNSFPTYTGSATPQVFEGIYFGKPNNGTIGVSVTKNSNGNNYIGNPYPSPVDAYMLLENNASLESLHFWTHEAPPITGAYAANNYASYTTMGGATAAAGGQEPDGMINVGQGFIAKTNQSVLVQFTNDLRIDYSYGQFFRRPAAERHRFWLNLTDDQANYNQILLGYVQNATNAFDHQIDGKLFGHSGSAIYSIIENDKYVIQGRSLPFDATDIIPLGFKAMQQGIYTISIDHMDGLFQEGEATIYLKDKLTNITHNLNEGNCNFVSEAGTFENRFEIVYQAETLGVQNPEMNNNNWIAFKSEGKLHVQSTGFDIESLEVFDITGRLLIQKNNVNSQSFECPAHFADQVLIVKVNKTLAKKVL